jgi:hypothetical protein
MLLLLYLDFPTQNDYRSAKSIYRLRQKYGLLKTRGQKHTVETISEALAELKASHPHRGAESLRQDLWHKHGMQVSRCVKTILL